MHLDRRLPPFAHVVRSLPAGAHAYTALLPFAERSPAMARIFPTVELRRQIVAGARVHIREENGYAWIDDEVPCVVLCATYYRAGLSRDLYLDLLHELTHLRQHAEGRDLWDESFPYVDRPTEIEGYAVAVEEGRRLGMSEEEVVEHLTNPWMTVADVRRLIENVHRFLGAGDSTFRQG